MVYAIDYLETSNINFGDYAGATSAQNPVSVLEQSSPQSSSRSGLRRMRTETTTPTYASDSDWSMPTIQKDFEPIESLIEQINKALQEGRYEKGLPFVNQIDAIWNGTLLDKVVAYLKELEPATSSHLQPALEFLGNGVIDEMKAYFHALTKDSDAIALCNSGFDKLRHGLSEVLALAREQNWAGPSDVEAQIEKSLDAAQHLMRGMIAMSLNMREMAIDDLRAGLSVFMAKDTDSDPEDFDDFDIESYFTIKALEQKLQASLLPKSPIVDDLNPHALFLADRYEEALKIVSTPQFKDANPYADVEGFRAACLALMGRHDEAFEILDGVDYGSPLESEIGIPLVLFLKGDFEKAKEIALDPDQGNIPFAYILLLAIQGSERNS